MQPIYSEYIVKIAQKIATHRLSYRFFVRPAQIGEAETVPVRIGAFQSDARAAGSARPRAARKSSLEESMPAVMPESRRSVQVPGRRHCRGTRWGRPCPLGIQPRYA